MTIDEAINKHIILSNENMTAGAEWYQKYINYQDHDYKNFADKCEKTAQEHKQYAEWLKELKELRMRDATLEERKSVDNYVKSISKDTGAVSRILAIETAIDAADEWDGGYDITREQIIRDALEKLPSVQPERPKGKWVRCDTDGCKCSECGAKIDIREEFRSFFCYHCGADMRGES